MHPTKQNQNQITNLSIVEITELLVKHEGLHEGLYNLSFEFQITAGLVPTKIKKTQAPGMMFGISQIGLSKTPKEKANLHTVDAAKVNPKLQKKATSKKK